MLSLKYIHVLPTPPDASDTTQHDSRAQTRSRVKNITGRPLWPQGGAVQRKPFAAADVC